MEQDSTNETSKLESKQTSSQLTLPKLFRYDTVDPSYTNLKLPYNVVCRERKIAYRRAQVLRQQAEIRELSLRQVRAWDGVRLARIFGVDQRNPKLTVRKVPDPLTPKERQRLYRILGS